MGATPHSLKEDLEHGRAKRESKEDFIRRLTGAGNEAVYQILEGRDGTFGYRTTQGNNSASAKQIQKALQSIGVNCDVFDGTVLWNSNGITGESFHKEAVTVDGKRVLINNDTDINPDNVAGHEAYHFWKNAQERVDYSEIVFDNIIWNSKDFLFYQSAISDAYFNEENVDLTNAQKETKFLEELPAFISGDIHEGTNDEFLRPMFRDYDAVKAAWDKLVQTQKNTAQEGGRRLSIKYDQNNTPYVVIENDVLDGVPQSEWIKTVKDNLREKFPDGISIGNEVISINKQSRMEMTFSKYMQRLFNTEPQLYADKLRATNNADEIMSAARNWVNEALLHPRKDAIVDFARGEVQLRIGENDYSAQVIVGNRGKRGLMLYDIINLSDMTIQQRTKKAGAVYTANAQNKPRSRGPAPTEDSIPQTETKSNTKFSLKDQSPEAMAQRLLGLF